MQLFVCVFALIAVVASDGTLQELETTSTPAVEQWDLASDINSFTSATADPTSYIKAIESRVLSAYSHVLSDMASSAASASSSLNLQLATADAAGSMSIQSHVSEIASNVSRASSALQAAVSAARSPTSTSTAGVGCVQTAAVGMAALVGGMAALAHL